MGLELENNTPLSHEEQEGLLISGMTTRAQLDEHEQKNIESAIQWLFTRSFQTKNIFNESFIRNLHKRMYGEVWSWAGEFRNANKNLGVDWTIIRIELKKLLEDTLYWITHNTYTPDEIAVRFKHRLVSIHCFPNGNGRHSRLMADIISNKIFKLPEFSWGSSNLANQTDVRKIYISALQKADKGDYGDLIQFARS